MIDLDSNATTSLLPEVLDAMLPWLRDNHANPSGSYKTAKLARKAIEQARQHVADLIAAEPDEIVFTGSGTESVNTALHSFDKLGGEGSALVSAIEHSAVIRFVESRSRAHQKIPVGAGGRVDISAFSAACEGAAYVSVMTANNETGVIQPISELLEIAKQHGIPFHTDAIQAAGKIRLNVREVPVDMLSLSAHKFHGPKGMGALFMRKGLSFKPLLLGGGQESGRRSSTENIASIVAMGEAARLAKLAHTEGVPNHIQELRDEFEDFLIREIAGCVRNGDPDFRLPNTSHLSFAHCDAAGLLILLDEAGIACSAGSACMTGKQKPSHVQLAMGIPEFRAKTSLRFSLSRLTTRTQLHEAAAKVKKVVEKLRTVQGTGIGPVAIYTN